MSDLADNKKIKPSDVFVDRRLPYEPLKAGDREVPTTISDKPPYIVVESIQNLFTANASNLPTRHGQTVAALAEHFAKQYGKAHEQGYALLDLDFSTMSEQTLELMTDPVVKMVSTSDTAAVKFNSVEADDIWKQSHTVFVASGGNAGKSREGLRDAAPLEYNHTTHADTMLRVGSIDSQHGNTIADYSSPSGVSFAVRNPFFQELEPVEYRFVRDHGEISALYIKNARFDVEQTLDAAKKANPKLAEELERQLMIGQANKIAQLKGFEGVFDAPAAERDVIFNQAILEIKQPEVRREINIALMSDYLNGHERALIEAHRLAERKREKFDPDGDGLSSQVTGTSFAQPHAASMVSPMLALAQNEYPRLTEYEITGAALIAASKQQDLTYHGSPVPFESNGRLRHGNLASGFGELTYANYEAVVRGLGDFSKQHPELSTQQTWVDAINFRHEGGQAYSYTIPQDSISLRTSLDLEFQNQSVPETITLVSPNGYRMAVPVSTFRETPDKGSLSTDAFFGTNSKGDWKIELPEGYALKNVVAHDAGFAKGGLMDAFLGQYTGERKMAQKFECSSDCKPGDALKPTAIAGVLPEEDQRKR